ncbi:REP-associated tyrosine transposase [Emticicia fluvialis]|uniref:REP-associated tyrosine transposase n=1 Tax=Emticicia fluvialis TaxID=2974474 RepID=UPI002166257A|nr:transposase [Emticicia fluvialis]
MSLGYQIANQSAIHYLTFQVVDWVDVFTRQVYRDILLDSFRYCQKEKGLWLYAYVVMSNHVHLIAASKDGRLSDLVRDIKKFTASRILKAIETEPESRRDWLMKRFEFAARSKSNMKTLQFWTHENHAVEIFTDKFFFQKVDYIHENPVRAGIVATPEDYLYSSASNFIDKGGLIEIEYFGPRFIDGSRQTMYF